MPGHDETHQSIHDNALQLHQLHVFYSDPSERCNHYEVLGLYGWNPGS